MSDRKQDGLRGPVRTCIEETTYASVVVADGTHIPERKHHRETECSVEGRMAVTRSNNSDGSEWLVREEWRAQLTKLMAGQAGPYSVSYSYDENGRVIRTSRRIFNEVEEIETTYNQYGDMASEITRSTRLGEETDVTAPASGFPSYSEVRYSYDYDDHRNWIGRAISYRTTPEGAFQSSTKIKRDLTYY